MSTPSIADDVFASLGIPTRDRSGDLAGACARIAQRLRANQIRVVGFLPADDTVAVPPLLVHLGIALAEPTGSRVAIVDANVRFPGLAAALGAAPPAAGSALGTRWLSDSLALISPPATQPAGKLIPTLQHYLATETSSFAHVLVDLTGFERLGEHAAAAAMVDAVAVVARANHTHERDVVEAVRIVPRDRLLGVTLVG